MMETRPLVILGSARKDSDTQDLIHQLFADLDYAIIDLLDHTLYPYDYAASYPADDKFLHITEQLLKHKVLVFATPVYWYAMSGPMKIFFDRFTDLMTLNKALGRQLKGKKSFLIAVGSDKALPEGFEVPFSRTSAYFGLDYIAAYYSSSKQLRTGLTDTHEFIEQLKTAALHR